jgi:nicotinamidase-related amidase
MKKQYKVHLLVIDPQNDFMDILAESNDPIGMELPDGTKFRSTLPVPGAVEDMKRTAELIDRIGHKLEDIHITLDSHRLIDIAHPAWWVDQNGNQPAPLTTIITVDDVQNGIWAPRNPEFRDRTLEYVKQLDAGGKYPLCIWPAHCLISTWGHNVQRDLNEALQRWMEKEFAMVNYVTKGSNPWTEHYGALMAEVPDPDDSGTALNTDFLEMLAEADIVAIAGEALSHCVKETVQQIADNIGPDQVQKFQILTDCSSPVPAVPNGPDFPQIAEDWLAEMEKLGMKLTTSKEFLA